MESAVSKYIIRKDTVAPKVTFGTNGNTTAAKTASTTVTVTDGGSGVKASSLKYLWTSFSSGIVASNFAGNHSGTFTSGGTISLPSGMGGDIYLWIFAQDNLGNQIITKSNKFTVSNIAPEADISLSTTAWTTGNVTMTIKPYAPTVLYDNGYFATTNRDTLAPLFSNKSYAGTKFRISGTVKTITTANSAVTTGAGFCYRNTSNSWTWPVVKAWQTGAVTNETAFGNVIYTVPSDYKDTLRAFFQINITSGTAGYKVEYRNIKYEYFDYTKIKSVTVNGTAITLTNGVGTYTATANGTYNIVVTDVYGNSRTFTQSVTNIDKEAPTISSVTASTTWDYSNDVTINATDNQAISAYAVTTTNTQPTEWIKTTSLDLSKVQTKRENGASWARVFYHNNRRGTTLFANETEAKSVDTAYKFSVLGALDNYKDSTGNWEFMLQYPKDLTGKYNRWKQTGNPATTTIANGNGSANAPGYSAVHIDWIQNYWGGLTKSTASQTFINGSVGYAWWLYAI